MLYVVLGSGVTRYMLCSLEWVEIAQRNEQHKMKPPTNAKFSFTVLNAIGNSIQRIKPNTPEDGHIDARNM